MQASEQLAQPRRWFWLALGLTIALGGLAVLGSYSLNLYGLFGNVRGKQYRVLSGDDRWSKYLLSMNYVPSNFDGLLVGSSKTQNWDTSRMTVARVYNGSLGGGNITEAKAIADNVLAKGKPRVVIFSIWPYMTNTSGFKSGELNSDMYYGALGSLRLYRSYVDYALYAMNRIQFDTNASGVERYGVIEPLGTLWKEGKPVPNSYPAIFTIDPTALAEYRELVASARKNGARIVRLRAPVYIDDYQGYRDQWDHYNATLDALFEPSDILVDFLTPEYKDFMSDRSNFMDGSHLTPAAGQWIVDEMDRKLIPLLK